MTLPNERYRAIEAAREFLRDLLDRKETPRIPLSIRKRAYCVLKHFPSDYDVRFLMEEGGIVIYDSSKGSAKS